MNVKAMQLWNDWNLQVLEYEKANVNEDFDYLVMRTEDLLDPEKKFQSLQQLAHFVGARRSLQDLCCQSQQAVVDMGESSGSMGDGRRRQRIGRKRLYDKLLAKEEETDWKEWFHRKKEPKEEDLQRIRDVLASAGSDETKQHNHHHHENQASHGSLGADPILGFIHGAHESGDWHSNTLYDAEEGRHVNWHHGIMNAGGMVEEARARRMEDLRRRNDRFKGLATRVADYKRKRTPRQYAKLHDKNSLEAKVDHGAHPKKEIIGAGDEHRRRLLSSFNKLQVRRNPYRIKKKTEAPEAEEEESPSFNTDSNNKSKQKHRQFKPRRHDGQPVFRDQGQTATKAPEPVGGKPGTSWSLSSIGQSLGLLSSQNEANPTRSEMDRAIVGKLQMMPNDQIKAALESAKEDLIPPSLELQGRHGKKKKKDGNVKARYGKWVAFLEDKPELSQEMHELGASGLEAFGYEPSALFVDTSGMDDSFHCGSNVVCEENNNDKDDEEGKRAYWRAKRAERENFVL